MINIANGLENNIFPENYPFTNRYEYLNNITLS